MQRRDFAPAAKLRSLSIFNVFVPALAAATLACFASQSVIPLRAQGQDATSPAPSQAAPSGAPAAAPVTGPAVGPDEVVLTIGEVKITAAEFEKVMAALPPQFAGTVNSMGKRGFAEQYANLRGMAMEGEKRQIDQRENFQRMMAFQRMLSLAQMTLNELANIGTIIRPEEITGYYQSHQSEFEQAKLRGIFIPFQAGAAPAANSPPEAGQPGSPNVPLTESQARAKAESLMNRIRSGEDMATLAKTESAHSSASQGGDFGYVGRSQFAPAISTAVFSLELNQVSEPPPGPQRVFPFSGGRETHSTSDGGSAGHPGQPAPAKAGFCASESERRLPCDV